MGDMQHQVFLQRGCHGKRELDPQFGTRIGAKAFLELVAKRLSNARNLIGAERFAPIREPFDEPPQVQVLRGRQAWQFPFPSGRGTGIEIQVKGTGA